MAGRPLRNRRLYRSQLANLPFTFEQTKQNGHEVARCDGGSEAKAVR
jgi:hypothetical protein